MQPATNPIQLDAVWDIDAGEAWELSVAITDGTAGAPVQVVLLNGLQTFDETLTLGTGGVAVWRVPAGSITQAGESLVIVIYGDEQRRQSLTVRAGEVVEGDFFSTGNTLSGYGKSKVTLLLLPRDEWGNPADDSSHFSVDIRYPSGKQIQGGFVYHGGMGRYIFTSDGEPGRVRLMVTKAAFSSTLELVQTAGEADSIDLHLSPSCVYRDGRDLVSLVATVQDADENPAVNGTLVMFTWADGQGYGRTVGGQATLRIPTPPETGTFVYRASVMNAQSNPAYLRVVQGECDG
ncbi:MAG: hypothetical protein MUF38_08025 [Anaerolineae bacterium]|nr:hypothetical protein [Anaerolineae bacterium]